MSRLDQLCQLLAEDQLSDDEAKELDQLIASSPAVEARFLALMECHCDLQAISADRGDRRAIMQGVWRWESKRAASGVRKVARRPLRRARTPKRSLSFGSLAAALAAALLLGLLALPLLRNGDTADLAVARIGSIDYTVGQSCTVPADAHVEHLDHPSFVDLESGARLRFAQRQLWQQRSGVGRWHFAEQQPTEPFVIETPQARVEILGTAFILQVDGRGSEILMSHGRVRFSSLLSDDSCYLEAGMSALIDMQGRLILPEEAAPSAAAKTPTATPTTRPTATIIWQANLAELTAEHPQNIRRKGSSLQLTAPTRLHSQASSRAINQALKASNAFSVLLELGPAADPDFDVRKVGCARILTLSGDQLNRNLTIGQGEMKHDWRSLSIRLRSHLGGRVTNGLPAFVVPDVFIDDSVTSLLISFDSTDGFRIYRNGQLIAEKPSPGNLQSWSDDFPLALGGENGVDDEGLRSWCGTYHRVVIYDQAITPADLD